VSLDAEGLFERWFLPLYPPRAELAALRTTDVNPANNVRVLAQLDAIAETFATLAPTALAAPDLVLDFSDASVHRLAACLTRERRDALLAENGAVVRLVTHGALYVGACAVKNHGGRWLMRNPLWESRVELRSRAGVAELAVFQWWLKSLSDAEIDEPRLADRYRLHVEVPSARPEELPIMASPERKLPRLSRVRYDTLHKYLRGHLPELSSVGDHFPSPERFSELGFQWLDFVLLGGGRMLLVHGPGERGVHLMWLDAAGFTSSAFFPADAAPEHRVRVDGDKIVVELPVLGVTEVHEMLWWGA
jgi:hypothetical protein